MAKMNTLSKLLLALFFALQGVGNAFAQDSTPVATPGSEEDRAITFHPEETGEGTYITAEGEPGESIELNVILGNSGNIDQSIRTYAGPAFSAANGGFVMNDYGTEPDAVTEWLEYPEQVFTFAPTEGARIPVIVNIPSDAIPGEYVTGIAAEQSDAYEVPGSDMFLQRTRWVIPVLIVVPGERTPAFELNSAELEWHEDVLYGTVGIANTGNVTLRPHGEVRLLDSEGTVVGVAEVEMQSVYTGTETTFVVAWLSPTPAEAFGLQIVLATEDDTVTVEKSFENLQPLEQGAEATAQVEPLRFSQADLTSMTADEPPSMLLFEGEIANNGAPIEDARVSIVAYQDGVEVDRYPIMQAVTIQPGETPVEARYSLPGGFLDGTYTFEVTVEIGSGSSQSVLITHPLDYEISVGD